MTVLFPIDDVVLVALEFFQDLFVLFDEYLVHNPSVPVFLPPAPEEVHSLERILYKGHHGRWETLTHHGLGALQALDPSLLARQRRLVFPVVVEMDTVGYLGARYRSKLGGALSPLVPETL